MKQSVKKIAVQFTDWFQENARTLPWRRKRPNPYHVWLSEIMLQQTQVVTVIPYFTRFTERFPTIHELAEASQDEVYELWAGLGYYSRARNLLKGAQTLSTTVKKTGRYPQTTEAWKEVPGVGDYTAGAVVSIVWNTPVPLVDGNVVRVLSRIFAIEKLDTQKTKIWELASKLVQVPSIEPRNLNQSLMELGALVCRPKNPNCGECPMRTQCLGKSNPLLYPEPKPKKTWKQLSESRTVLVSSDAQIYLEQNHETRWRKGLWDFPQSPVLLKHRVGKLLGEFDLKYVVTTHKISRNHRVFQVEKPAKIENGKWFSLDTLPALPAPTKKAILRLQSFIEQESYSVLEVLPRY